MLYKDFIKADEGFQYSINLQYDLNKYTKVAGYIPTSDSTEILKIYLKSIYYNSKDRASILVGPYGKGKSHLLLILLSILSTSSVANNEDAIDSLCRKVGSISKDVEKMILEIRGQNKRLLPVIINSNYYDLKQAFLIGIKDALERESLNHLIPKTYFESIIETESIWRTIYPETYKVFKEKLSDYGLSIKNFLDRVNNYDDETYEIFKKIHPQITSGVEFNPLINSDVVRLYEEVNYKLCESGDFKGIFIVFDEFSKFLEASVTRNSAHDIKLIQDFAELSNRSGDNQIHFSCITHKSINDYISNLPKEKIDAWRAVEGRFKEIYFTSSSQQNYELIANAIIKDEDKFKEFKSLYSKEIRDIQDNCERMTIYNEMDNFSEIIGDGCFPLNPISVYVLPRISEKVAQNERTLFTFLSKEERGSLVNFINCNNGGIGYLTIDWIYDYFEILFKKEVFNENVHSIWLKSNNALLKTEDENQKKIIKAISIIHIVNEFMQLPPTDLYIRLSIGLNKFEYDLAISQLINSQTILKKKSNGYYRFLPGSELNVFKKIADRKDINSNRINVREVIEATMELGFETPKKYNDEYEMVRYFKKSFITADEFENIRSINDLTAECYADGVILYLIYLSDKEKEVAFNKLIELKDSRILMCFPDKSFAKLEEVKELLAIKYLRNDAEFNQNELAMQELDIFEDDIISDIDNYINSSYDVKNGSCKYYDFNGPCLEIKNRYQLNRKLSDICFKVFGKTPVINNELINKRNISSPIVKARNKILQYIFEEMENGNEFISKGNGPEITIFRTTITRKGLLDSRESNDNKLNSVLNEIEGFILSCEDNKNSFAQLYSTLYDAEFGYGLRAGIIPIYIALKIREHLENIIIYFGEKEVSLSIDTLNKINDNPDKYSLLLEKGSKEKDEYLNTLENLFSDYKSNKDAGYSRYNSIVEAMRNWMYSLPKYTSRYNVIPDSEEGRISNDIIVLRKELLKFDINPRELLLIKLNSKILKLNDFKLCIDRINEIKLELDTFVKVVKQYLIKITKNIFDKGYRGELRTALENWYNELPEENKEHLYDISENSLLSFISTLSTGNEDTIIEKLAKIVTGLNIEDWNDDTLEVYLNGIEKITSTIRSYKKQNEKESSSSYEISFYVEDEKVSKSFDSSEISSIGRTVYNTIEEALDEYGESIDINEKRNIIMKLLEKYM
ncbi:MAG: hypothetical protein Q8936_21495 [Bacillota bacterium]|nr:hypothetical protein [Bacillota bacterium]